MVGHYHNFATLSFEDCLSYDFHWMNQSYKPKKPNFEENSAPTYFENFYGLKGEAWDSHLDRILAFERDLIACNCSLA
jgi:hypothetical protein